MSFPYKKVLITGATSGIGLELAERILGQGVPVIATGRRQDRLDALKTKFGADKVTTVTFDLAEIDKVTSFAQD